MREELEVPAVFWRVDCERFDEAAGAVVVCRPVLGGAAPRGSGALAGAGEAVVGTAGVSLDRVSAGSAMVSTAAVSSVVLSAASASPRE